MERQNAELFELKFKEQIQSNIMDISNKIHDYNMEINKIRKTFNLSEILIPQTGIFLNNKINELSSIFTSAGLSFYISKTDAYVVNYSFVGYAIISDLFSMCSLVVEELTQYYKIFMKICDEKLKEENNKKTFKLGIFKHKKNNLFLSNAEINILQTFYDGIVLENDKIINYKLENNLVETLTKYLKKNYILETTYLSVLNIYISPILKKLNLQYLMPKLECEIQNNLVDHTNKKI